MSDYVKSYTFVVSDAKPLDEQVYEFISKYSIAVGATAKNPLTYYDSYIKGGKPIYQQNALTAEIYISLIQMLFSQLSWVQEEPASYSLSYSGNATLSPAVHIKENAVSAVVDRTTMHNYNDATCQVVNMHPMDIKSTVLRTTRVNPETGVENESFNVDIKLYLKDGADIPDGTSLVTIGYVAYDWFMQAVREPPTDMRPPMLSVSGAPSYLDVFSLTVYIPGDKSLNETNEINALMGDFTASDYLKIVETNNTENCTAKQKAMINVAKKFFNFNVLTVNMDSL